MVEFIGRNENLALFSNGVEAAIIDTNVSLVVGLGKTDAVLASRDWEPTNETFSDSTLELASGALTTLDIKVITASGRMYTIPDGVVSEAKKALKWHKEEKRGGTPVGLNSAHTLARGGQIGIEKIRHIAKYFPRHEVDKKGKGWEPGEDGFPSNGRIAWALWGGDSAWRWARAIVERENKKATTAGGYTVLGYDADPEIYQTNDDYAANVDAFKDAFEMSEGVAPEFMARVRLDGSGMDRLYKLDTDGQVYVWDDMGWDSLGHVDGDIWTYDKALDDPYDTCEKDHTIIDPESAMIMSALFQENPYDPISINDVAPEEAEMFEYAAPEEDWDFLKTITAAMSPAQAAPGGAIAQDGVYSPKERSVNAKNQTRDAGGMFVAKGSRVVVGNDGENGRGIVTGVNSTTGGTKVKLDNGKTIDVPAKMTQKEDKFTQADASASPANVPTPEELAEPLDVSGILGEPRSPINQPAGRLPGTLPPMDQGALQSVLQNWGGYVESQRAAFNPITDQQAKDYAKRTGQIAIPNPAKLDPNTTRNAGAASKQVAVPGENGQISVQDAPMMAGRADFKPGGDSGDSDKDKLRNQLQGIKDRTTYHNKIFTPSDKGSTTTPPTKPDSRNAPGTNVPRPPNISVGDSRNAPGSNKSNSKSNPGAWDTGKNGTGRTGPAKPAPTPPGAGKGGGKSAPTPSKYDAKGRYIVQKGDSLWTIAEKTVPKGVSIADHWRQIMKSNPNMKSGDPNLIFSGEHVWIPGSKGSTVTGNKGATPPGNKGAGGGTKNVGKTSPVKPADSRNAPGSNRKTPVGDSRNAPGSNASPKPPKKPTKPVTKGQPGAWDTGKNGTGKLGTTTSEPKYKPVGNNKTAEHAKAGLDMIIKPKGSAGSRRRRSGR
jgi:hypothetical protein